MSKKLLAILEGAATIVLGVLVAVFGGQAVLNLYFGILFLVAGAGVLAFVIAGLARTKIVLFPPLFIAVALIFAGSFMLVGYLSFGLFVDLLVVLLVAAGFALALYGVYTLVKLNLFQGVGQIVVGGALATFGLCYIYIFEFRLYFWIIVGCLIAVYGLIYLLAALFTKSENEVIDQKAE